MNENLATREQAENFLIAMMALRTAASNNITPTINFHNHRYYSERLREGSEMKWSIKEQLGA
jgi:hypothetical protein